MTKSTTKLSEVVKTLELSEIEMLDDALEPIKYRIEVLKDLTLEHNHYYARVSRWETYRMTPRFVGTEKEPGDVQCDSEVLILDDEFRGREIARESVDEVVNGVIEYMRSRGYIK